MDRRSEGPASRLLAHLAGSRGLIRLDDRRAILRWLSVLAVLTVPAPSGSVSTVSLDFGFDEAAWWNCGLGNSA